MPEFELDYGTQEATKAFAQLDSFTQGYTEAMFFTECHADNEEFDGASFDDLASETLTVIVADCKAFQEENEATLNLAYDYAPAEYDAQRAGNDFWYTRNHHGTGYWDRGLGDRHATGTVGAILTVAAHACRECSLCRGDDGKLYLEG